VPYSVIITDTRDILSTGYDLQGNFGVFSAPVGVISIPVVQKVCENDHIYSEPGKLGYQNMINSDYRYWWNVYNAHRLHIVTPLSYWSLVAHEIDYREKTNLDLMTESWNVVVHGLSVVAEKMAIGGQMSNRIALVLVPRFPIRGDTRTVSGRSYWELNKSSIYSDFPIQVAGSGFGMGFLGRYWDGLLLGPQAGAILVNIWWDEEVNLDSELIVSLKALAPQWFGAARWRGGLYTDLLKYLRDAEYSLGGLGARLGLRELVVPVRGWLGPVRMGSIVNQDIMEDLETLGDKELTRYRDENSNPIPMFWQVVGLKWDIGRNMAFFRFLETRDGQWTPLNASEAGLSLASQTSSSVK
ncbi:MAG: hypothetical protein ACPL68_07665, partial [Candidatus Hydrothermia bacterium]